MEVIYKEGFFKELKKLPARIQESIRYTLIKLGDASSLESSELDYALMRGGSKGQKFYRIRVGNYRIGIKYIYPDVLVITIAVRGDIYKTFPPK
ncbi:toxin RelE [Dyadobacter endophyticus]|uniref:Toxin RelE n=1 Tax=Dyadobacter endophyticus TaxID=1749036 RepID=A0ABQ1Z6B3_9BACT|nr:toxin RelE [Dyadobacter endophyticus]